MTRDDFKQIRLRLGLSQAQLARILGYETPKAVRRLEMREDAGQERDISPMAAAFMCLLEHLEYGAVRGWLGKIEDED